MRREFAQLSRFLVLFAAVFILLTGHGLQLTLLPLRAAALGWAPTDVGITASFYFAGFFVGCLFIPRLVAQVGHIRVFSATTTLLSVALILVVLTDSAVIWSGLRFLTGIGISGSYIVIESWLNAQTTNRRRGRTLAIYTMIVMAAMTLGQVIVTAAPPSSAAPVVIGSVILSCALLPLTLVRVEQPVVPHKPEFALREVFAAAPAAVGTAFIFGMATGAMFTVTPLATAALDWDYGQSAQGMMAIVLGGAALQYPAGRLSDRFDRRRVIAAIVVAALLVVGPSLFNGGNFLLTLLALFLFGGLASAVYPICLAHANDRLPGQFLQVGTVILLVNSLGAVIGPSGAAALIDAFDAAGYAVFMLIVLAVSLLWLLGCILRRTAPAVRDPYVAVPKGSPAAIELDPRNDPPG